MLTNSSNAATATRCARQRTHSRPPSPRGSPGLPPRKRRRRQREREAAYRVGPAWRRLRVAPSTIKGAGEGLFATQAIAAHETIGFYRGEVLTLREALQLKDRDYLMGGFGPNAHVDASKAFAMPGRYVGDPSIRRGSTRASTRASYGRTRALRARRRAARY